MTSPKNTPAAALILALAAASTALAGDINPPPGPVTPTMKTLNEVEPRVPIGPDTTPGDAAATFAISAPGSYYLTGDITADPGKPAIQIRDAPVTLDLNGFTIRGGDSPGTIGVQATPAGDDSGFIIRNGFVEHCERGIQIIGILESTLIENVVIHHCLTYGFEVEHATLRNCTAAHNTSAGFLASIAILESCLAHDNGDNSGQDRGGYFLYDSSADNCLAHANEGSGFYANRCSLNACRSHENLREGFRVEFSSIRDSDSEDDEFDAFSLDWSSQAVNCRASFAGQNGFSAANYSTVRDCDANSNAGAGISLADSCLALSNHCAWNQTHGITTVGDEAVVKGNTAVHNRPNNYELSGANNTVLANVALKAQVVNYNDSGAGNNIAPIQTPATCNTANDNITD